MEIPVAHGLSLFEWSEFRQNLGVGAAPLHSGIVDEDLEKLESAPWEVAFKEDTTWSLNGRQLGSAAPITGQDIQERLFKARRA